MADLKVGYESESMGDEVTIYASPETLREIAGRIETTGSVWIDGKAVDLDEPVRICFAAEYPEDEEGEE